MPSNNVETSPKAGFRRRHPVLFVFGVLFMAMALTTGAMAFFSSPSTSSSAFDDGAFKWPHSDTIGIVTIEGTIESSDKVVAFLRKLRRDSDVKGVLLRVNSGGGGFGPSQEIYRAVATLAEKKPVIATFGSVAASGGYYAACPAKLIYALPGTITGSIGVRSQYPEVLGLTDKIGVTFHTFASGRLKDAGSPFKQLSAEDKAYIEDLLSELHGIFLGDVATARKLTFDKLNALQGRAVTGASAIGLGLVDKIGSQEDAMEELKKLTGVSKPAYLRGPKRQENKLEDFFGMLGSAFFKGMQSGLPASGPRAE